jgi:hypothetical protein
MKGATCRTWSLRSEMKDLESRLRSEMKEMVERLVEAFRDGQTEP